MIHWRKLASTCVSSSAMSHAASATKRSESDGFAHGIIVDFVAVVFVAAAREVLCRSRDGQASIALAMFVRISSPHRT